jgi:hypothetical protein
VEEGGLELAGDLVAEVPVAGPELRRGEVPQNSVDFPAA